MGFTDKQLDAINTRKKNILVSAAAGSGKTTVLVERIIRRILDENDPIDIDRILVMTFTDAAASSMREKILKSIDEKLKENPDNKHLQKQAALVHNANIMTIDSFCMRVVRNHFTEIDIEPGFRICDKGEAKLIMQDILDDLFEEEYKNADEDFITMSESFATGVSDNGIDDIILKLYDYAESYPDPDVWLEECKSLYESATIENIEKQRFIDSYIYYIKNEVSELKTAILEYEEICERPFGPKPYLNSLCFDEEVCNSMLNCTNLSDFYRVCDEYKAYSKVQTGRCLKNKQDTVEEAEERERLKTIVYDARSSYKLFLKDIIDSFNENTKERLIEDIKKMSPAVIKLLSLTSEFRKRYSAIKRKKNIAEFSDVEHMCLQILRSKNNKAALEYKDYFEEVYVDEYQDSDLVQEEILKYVSKEDETSGNLFMVGDVKQSIYGFRLAKPQIFIDKYNRFSSDKSLRDYRIDLHHNFRSRIEVINSVNDVFEKIMKQSTGGIEYDDNAKLHIGAKYPIIEKEENNTGVQNDLQMPFDFIANSYKTEMLVGIKETGLDSKEYEAHIVAKRIKQLMKDFKVTDEKSGELRKVRYSDIVILLRTGKTWDNIFMNVLESEGIPVYVSSTTGYFSAKEVAILLDYLKVIDNPYQDIPLAAVLVSLIGSLTDENLARIRGAFPENNLYDSIIQYIDTYKNDESEALVVNKINKFIKELSYYRTKSQYTGVAEILSEIIDGEYGRIVSAMTNGKKRMANLNMLVSKAHEFAKMSYKGLFHFNRYIENIKKYDIDFGEANVNDDENDTVRIMNIHTSKGLEFPVCIISEMCKGMNTSDIKGLLISDVDLGIGCDTIDVNRRTKTSSFVKACIAKKKKMEIFSEEMRLLYVAMTRAKEKLIMTGVDSEKKVNGQPVMKISDAKSYFDLYRYAGGRDIDSIEEFIVSAEDVVEQSVGNRIRSEVSREMLLNTINNACNENEINKDDLEKNVIIERLLFEYPVENGIAGKKFSVSDLKHKAIELMEDEAKESVDETVHVFSSSSKGAAYGTAVHRIFELYDYSLDGEAETVKHFISDMYEKRRIDKEAYEIIRPADVYTFVNSNIAKRMKKAYEKGCLYREQPFVIGVPSNITDYFGELSDAEKLNITVENIDDMILIQGIIDAYFIEDDEIVVVDYKTDNRPTIEDIGALYKTQLDYYAMALSRLTGKNVKEKIIYSTKFRKELFL